MTTLRVALVAIARTLGFGTVCEAGEPLAISEIDVPILHRSIRISASYERVTTALEEILGRFSKDVEKEMASAPKLAEERIRSMEGEQGLMIFLVLDHGSALTIVGGPRKAKQYLIGNPLTAIQMTRRDLRAALYAPLRILVYEDANGRTTVEYDQPSSLFGQFHNPDVTAVGVSLDQKLEAVIRRAGEIAK